MCLPGDPIDQFASAVADSSKRYDQASAPICLVPLSAEKRMALNIQAPRLLDQATEDRLACIAAKHQSVLPDFAAAEVGSLSGAMRSWRYPALMRDFGKTFTRQWSELHASLSREQRRSFPVYFLAKRALQIESTLADRSLTPSLLRRYPLALTRLVETLESPPEAYQLDDELFIKDLRMVHGLGIPAGASVLELRSAMGGVILQAVARRDPLWVLRAVGRVPCFRLYLDPRYLDDFNREGMLTYYKEAGELLLNHPDVYGFVCRSWFMDPQLASISPRLAYLAEIPMAAGAFVVNRPASSKDIERAIKTSPTRQRLYASGVYKPLSTSLVWPRKQMIEWATSLAGV